jgi:FkbM family methyltransferase
MKKVSQITLKNIVNMPLNAIGLALVRRTQVYPTWQGRMKLAKKLGFSPRVIFDGGAFRGIWSRDAAHLFPGAQIVLIEPNPFVQKYIARNISHVEPPPRILNLALGESSGKAKFNIWGEEESNTGASLLNHVSGEANKVIEVDVDTIDNISQQMSLIPDLVKLDLQGGELSALKGATRVLKHTEVMMIEFGCLAAYIERTTPRDLMEIMYENDYCLYDIIEYIYRPYDGALTGGDFMFVKNSSALRGHKDWK